MTWGKCRTNFRGCIEAPLQGSLLTSSFFHLAECDDGVQVSAPQLWSLSRQIPIPPDLIPVTLRAVVGLQTAMGLFSILPRCRGGDGACSAARSSGQPGAEGLSNLVLSGKAGGERRGCLGGGICPPIIVTMI